MDQHTWNTYHLVGNRARAVCYSTRQQQFHAKTEMTVNKLMWSSEQQVSLLKVSYPILKSLLHLNRLALQTPALQAFAVYAYILKKCAPLKKRECSQ